MAYTPNNLSVYTAAFAGMLSGISGDNRWPESTTATDYAALTAACDAFAQAFDTAWGANPDNTYQQQTISGLCAASWVNRTAKSTTPSDYTVHANALIAIIAEGSTQIASEGITPSPDPSYTGAFVSVNAFGAKGDGVADDSNSFITQWNAQKNTNISQWIVPGTYPGIVPNNTMIRGGAASLLAMSMAYTGMQSQTVFQAFRFPAIQTGSLVTQPVLDTATTIRVALPVAPGVNETVLYLQNTNQGMIYDIQNVTALGGGHYDVAVDRAVALPFPTATTVVYTMSGYPKDIRIDGQGTNASGTGDRLFEIAGSLRCIVSDLHYNPSLGTLGDTVGSMDVGGRENVIQDCSADLTGAGAGVIGFMLESQERSVIQRMNVRNCPSYAYAIFDSIGCGMVDCNATGGGALSQGATVGTDGATQGCFDCYVDDCTFIECGTGLYITGVNNLDVKNLVAVGCGLGLSTASTSLNVKIRGCDLSNSTLNYAAIGADADISDIVATGLTAGGLGINITGSGLVTFDRFNITHAGTNANYLFYCTSTGTVNLKNGNSAVVQAGSIAIFANTGIVNISNLNINAAAGCVALNVAAGGTLNIGPGVVISGAGTALSITAGGVVSMNQTGGVAALNATVSLTFAQHYNTAIEYAAGAAANGTITTYAIPGMTWVINNLSGHTLTLKTSTAATVVVATTKKTVVYVAANGDMTEVTAVL